MTRCRLLPLSLAGCILMATCTAAARQESEESLTRARHQMVGEQLRARDIKDPRVLAAMERVPRHRFVPLDAQREAYGDHPLPIGHGQTISQPYIVAFMSQALDVHPGEKVLEVGTGSGYQAAVLAELGAEVYTIEIIEALAESARRTLADLGYTKVHVRAGNGYLGWPEEAPFDRIIVTAAPEEVPPALVAQLKLNGIMAIPVGSLFQDLKVMRKTASGMETLKTLPVRFVPMTGKPKKEGS